MLKGMLCPVPRGSSQTFSAYCPLESEHSALPCHIIQCCPTTNKLTNHKLKALYWQAPINLSLKLSSLLFCDEKLTKYYANSILQLRQKTVVPTISISILCDSVSPIFIQQNQL